LKDIYALSFKLRFNQKEINLSELIDSYWELDFDFLDINVDNWKWFAEIVVANTKPFTLWKNLKFIKLQVNTWDVKSSKVKWLKTSLQISNIEFIWKNFLISQWKWRSWSITIENSGDKPDKIEIFSLSTNVCEINKECETTVFWRNIWNLSFQIWNNTWKLADKTNIATFTPTKKWIFDLILLNSSW
jgi:hypothetical protein